MSNCTAQLNVTVLVPSIHLDATHQQWTATSRDDMVLRILFLGGLKKSIYISKHQGLYFNITWKKLHFKNRLPVQVPLMPISPSTWQWSMWISPVGNCNRLCWLTHVYLIYAFLPRTKHFKRLMIYSIDWSPLTHCGRGMYKRQNLLQLFI